MMTIPTSNSLTGNPIQLLADGQFDQQLSLEGANDLDAPADRPSGELQPSTLPSWLHGTSAKSHRALFVVALAVGILAIALLVLALGQGLALIVQHLY
jgi:hypothetical protein